MAVIGGAQPLIAAQNIQKAFHQNTAVDGVSFRVKAGEIYGLVGPDGAGKTTTLRLLCGVLALDGGSATVGGFDVRRQTEAARSQIGYLPQRFSLYEDLTVEENIRFFAEVRGLSAQDWRSRSLKMIDFVGLSDFTNRRAGRLSGGMKQKLGLAVALVHQPAVLLLDEPTTGVDPVTRQDFWQLIIRLVQKEGVAVLVSTPYMDEAARCHKLGFMRAGTLQLEGTPAEIRSRLDGRILEVIGHPLQMLRTIAANDPDVEDAQMFGDRLHLRTRPGQVASITERLKIAAGTQAASIDTIRAVAPQLEDVFIAIQDANITELPSP